MGGLAYSNPPFNTSIYELFYPHYLKAIKNNAEMTTKFSGDGLVRHLVAFYFWGFEDLEKEGLIIQFIKYSKPTSIENLISFMWRQDSYLQSLSKEEASKIEILVFKLWDYLLNKYQDKSSEEVQKVCLSLLNLLSYASELNKSNTELVLKACTYMGTNFYTHFVIQNLIRLLSKGIPSQTANYIGQILMVIQFDSHFTNEDQNAIIELIIFLYENNQKNVANQFCNNQTKIGNEFLRPVYNSYNSF